MEAASQETARQIQQYPRELSPDGLNVVNARGYLDPANGDLVVTGTIENTTDRQKPGWYLEIEVYDSSQSVLSVIRVVNGVQIFAKRDYEILEKRGMNIDEVRTKNIAAVRSAVIPARGSAPFAVRLFEPPAGITGFLPYLRKFDPVAVFGDMAEQMKH
jgi:hypothetical protein